jgi:hypothetical protein
MGGSSRADPRPVDCEKASDSPAERGRVVLNIVELVPHRGGTWGRAGKDLCRMQHKPRVSSATGAAWFVPCSRAAAEGGRFAFLLMSNGKPAHGHLVDMARLEARAVG